MRRIQIVFTVLLGFALTTACSHDPELTANAGSNFEHNVTIDGTTVRLSGSSNGAVAGYRWSCTGKPSGAADPSFSDTAVASPTVSGFNKLGEYQFTLKVTDNKGAESAASAVKVLLYRQANVTITVAANLFTAGLNLNFAPKYSGWTAEIPAGSVTYTLTSANPTIDLNSYSGVIPANIYSDMATPIFTQIFYHNNQEVGRRSVVGAVMSPNFAAIGNNTSDLGTLTNIPAVTPSLSLSKKITEGNM
jgi:hypothetical protein